MSVRSPAARRGTPALPAVSISEDGEVRFLHLGTEWVQGSMLLDAPFDIELEYVQRMMAWLLFVDADQVGERKAMQLGLGAAALTKFHARRLRMDTTAVEINPQVVAACRNWFRLPADGPRLRVLLADAADVVHDASRHGSIDALQVDLYDAEAAAPVLDSPDFYSACRDLLSVEGCMTVNLFGRNAHFDQSLQRIVEAFGAASVWVFKPTREGNAVVLALRTPQWHDRLELLRRAEIIQDRWGLPAVKWLKVLRPPAMDTFAASPAN